MDRPLTDDQREDVIEEIETAIRDFTDLCRIRIVLVKTNGDRLFMDHPERERE